MGELHNPSKRTQADRDAARTARNIVRASSIRDDLARRPSSRTKDELLALVEEELAALNDPRYQAARLEADRCLAQGRRLPPWANRAMSSGPSAR
jgi:hypothetical protein